MWGIEFSSTSSRVQLPLITTQAIVLLVGSLFFIRLLIHFLIERLLGIHNYRK